MIIYPKKHLTVFVDSSEDLIVVMGPYTQEEMAVKAMNGGMEDECSELFAEASGRPEEPSE